MSFPPRLTLLFWTADMALAFSTGYYHVHGTIEMKPSRIALHYLRTWMRLEVSNLPFEAHHNTNPELGAAIE